MAEGGVNSGGHQRSFAFLKCVSLGVSNTNGPPAHEVRVRPPVGIGRPGSIGTNILAFAIEHMNIGCSLLCAAASGRHDWVDMRPRISVRGMTCMTGPYEVMNEKERYNFTFSGVTFTGGAPCSLLCLHVNYHHHHHPS